jgi:dihydropteroate synthase
MSPHWLLGGKRIDLARPRVMAIVNATPDSFHAGSLVQSELPDYLAPVLEALLAQGPDIVDIGGQSTRPGSPRVGAAEELRRVRPVLEELRKLDDAIPVTVDTYHASVAHAALELGADGVNDISAGRLDDRLLDIVAAGQCGYVLMHMQGTPETMQDAPHYADCAGEVEAFLRAGLAALEQRGIARERVALDPGIGFGKRLQNNLDLLNAAGRLAALGAPLLYGVSRKRFIANACADLPPAAQPVETEARLAGTAAVTWHLLQQGVMLHRLHDVAAARQVFALWEALQPQGAPTIPACLSNMSTKRCSAHGSGPAVPGGSTS